MLLLEHVGLLEDSGLARMNMVLTMLSYVHFKQMKQHNVPDSTCSHKCPFPRSRHGLSPPMDSQHLLVLSQSLLLFSL